MCSAIRRRTALCGTRRTPAAGSVSRRRRHRCRAAQPPWQRTVVLAAAAPPAAARSTSSTVMRPPSPLAETALGLEAMLGEQAPHRRAERRAAPGSGGGARRAWRAGRTPCGCRSWLRTRPAAPPVAAIPAVASARTPRRIPAARAAPPGRSRPAPASGSRAALRQPAMRPPPSPCRSRARSAARPSSRCRPTCFSQRSTCERVSLRSVPPERCTSTRMSRHAHRLGQVAEWPAQIARDARQARPRAARGLWGLGTSGMASRSIGASRSKNAVLREHRRDLRAEAGGHRCPRARSGSGGSCAPRRASPRDPRATASAGRAAPRHLRCARSACSQRSTIAPQVTTVSSLPSRTVLALPNGTTNSSPG